MSFWAKVKTQVKDLRTFEEMCEKHNVRYELWEGGKMKQQGMDVYAVLNDKQGGSRAYLCKSEKTNDYRMVIDNDSSYSSLTRRLGANGGILMRDYAVAVTKKAIMANGGFVTSEVMASDGSIHIKCGLASGY